MSIVNFHAAAIKKMIDSLYELCDQDQEALLPELIAWNEQLKIDTHHLVMKTIQEKGEIWTRDLMGDHLVTLALSQERELKGFGKGLMAIQ